MSPSQTLCEVQNDALIFPAIHDFQGNGYIHGIAYRDSPGTEPVEWGYSQDGASATDAGKRREFYRQHERALKTVSGKYLYLGALPNHFGHLLGGCAHRLWAASEMETEVDGFIMLPDRSGYPLTRLQKDVLGHFGVNLEKIRLVDELTVVQQLVIPRSGAALGSPAAPWYPAVLERHYNQSEFLKPGRYPEKIVVSRRNFLGRGRVAGFDYIKKYLCANGYYEVLPEYLSLKEQLYYLSNASIIVWEEGSACHLLDIMPRIYALGMLVKRRENSFRFDEAIRTKTRGTVYGEISRAKNAERRKADGGAVNFVDVNHFIDTLKREGFCDGTNFDMDEFRLSEIVSNAYSFVDHVRTKENAAAADHILNAIRQRTTRAPGFVQVAVERFYVSGVEGFSIDSPKQQIPAGGSETRVSGWVLLKRRQADARVTAEAMGSASVSTSLSINRPDVAQHVLKVPPGTAGSDLYCGFEMFVPGDWQAFSIFVETAKLGRQLLARVTLQPPDACN